MNIKAATTVLWALSYYSVLTASATIYYVKFDTGNDANTGISTAAPWQHCPGDPNATGSVRTIRLQPGDTVQFAGGVTYRGTVRLNANGGVGSPITYSGTGWGPTNAIFSGGSVITTPWTNCSSAQDVWGNANYANVWRTAIPAGLTNPLTLVYISNSIVPIAQSPTPQDPINWGHWQTEWTRIVATNITTSSVVDPAQFNQTNANFWNSAWMVPWAAGDIPDIIPITNYVPASNMVQFAMDEPLPAGNTYYTVLNQPALINGPGQVAIRPDENRIYLWPPNSSTPNGQTVEYSTQTIAFWNTGVRNLVFNGIKFVGAASAFLGNSFSGGYISNILIENCDMSCSRAMVPHAFPIYFSGGGGSAMTVSNCAVHDMQSCGITFQGDNVQVLDCQVYHLCSYNFSGIYFLYVTNGLIANNVVHAIYGGHDNGVTAYEFCSNVVFSGNYVYDCPSVTCMSLQRSANISVLNNVLDGGGTNQVLNDFNGMTGYFNILNNTIVRGVNNDGLALTSTGAAITLANNILSGGTTMSNVTRFNNIYCDMDWTMDPRYGWSLGPGEVIQTNYAVIFTNGWHLASNSPAIGAGTNLTTFLMGSVQTSGMSLASLAAPLTSDLDGAARAMPPAPQWDIGALSAAIPRLAAPTALRIVGQ